MTTDWDVRVVRGSAAVAQAIAFPTEAAWSTPFQHPDWLATWVKVFADTDEPRVFLIEVRAPGSSEPVLRLPLGLEVHSGVRVLRGWDRGTADYGGPIVARGAVFTPTEIAGLWAKIRAASPRADVVVVDKMPARLGDGDNPLLALPGIERSFTSGHVLHLDAPGAAERFDGTMRRSLARKRRKLSNKGTLAFRWRPAGEAPDALEALLDWRRARFATENRDRDVASVETFWRRLAAETAIARTAELTLDGRLLAAGFGTRTGESFQLLATGFDVAWKNWSPGLILAEDLIAAAERDGVRRFDFTIGEEAYKLDFDVEPVPLFDLVVPLTLRGFAAGWIHRLRTRRRRRRIEAMHDHRSVAET